MAKKLDYNDICTELGKFISATAVHFDSHSYAAGALQAQLAFVLSTLPAHKQQETLQVLAQLAAKYSTK
jgi:UDP-N-acetylmuramyl pentapeptide synthase